MLHFKCPDCSAGLRASDARAGKLTACPSCGRKVRAPLGRPQAPEIVEELPVVEDEDEEEAMEAVEAAEDDEDEDEGRDEEENDRPRRRRRKRVVAAAAPDDDASGGGDFVTRNRIMGAIGVILGLGFTIGALCSRADFRNPLTTPYNMGGCLGLLLGLLLLVVGIIYAVRG